MAKEDLRARELPGSPQFLLDALLAASKEIVAEGENLRLASHRVTLKLDEEEAVGKLEAAFERAGLAVPSVQEALEKSGVEPARARNLLQILLRDGRLVRVSEELVFHRSAIKSLKAICAKHKGERFAVPAFKDWTGISRKYAIPLLEFLDRERITRREGDVRVVL
jgi:selenocysteine-specific elongation factor